MVVRFDRGLLIASALERSTQVVEKRRVGMQFIGGPQHLGRRLESTLPVVSRRLLKQLDRFLRWSFVGAVAPSLGRYGRHPCEPTDADDDRKRDGSVNPLVP